MEEIGYHNAADEFEKKRQPDNLPTIDIRVVQRKSKKWVTLISGLPENFQYVKLLSTFKKDFQCGGALKKDKESGEKYIMLFGDHRTTVSEFLVKQEITSESNITIHGF